MGSGDDPGWPPNEVRTFPVCRGGNDEGAEYVWTVWECFGETAKGGVDALPYSSKEAQAGLAGFVPGVAEMPAGWLLPRSPGACELVPWSDWLLAAVMGSRPG